MPDVSWYSGQGLRINSTLVRDGTTNRLLRNDGTRLQNSVLSDDGTNVTLASGVLFVPSGAAGAGHLALAATPAQGWYWSGTDFCRTASGSTASPVFRSTTAIGFGSDLKLIWTSSSGNGTTGAGDDTGFSRNAAGVIEINNGTAGTFRDLITRAHVIGTAAATVPASPYLIIQGVSGAGGTPTTSHLTAGSGVAAYVQEAHDGQATKYVVAYNNYNGVTYLSIPLDGSTVAWTQSQTRP